MFKTKRCLSRSIFLSTFILLALIGLISLLFPIQTMRGAPNFTYTVNSSGDEPDDDLADYACLTAGGLCTLRAAIQQVNFMLTTHNEILFSEFMLIAPDTELPALTNPDGVTIYSDDHVYLLGTNLAGGAIGLSLASDNNEIMGLVIAGFYNGIVVTGDNNLIGTDGDGIDDTAERNVIYSNNAYGIQLEGSNNIVAGNYIGLDTNGSGAGPNEYGILVAGNNNRIGTDGNGSADAAERNVISGNEKNGITVNGDHTVIAGNYIGIKAAGSEAQPNGINGAFINLSATNTRIGTNSDGSGDTAERNIISGNSGEGITNQGDYTTIMGNFVGTNPSGTAAIPNGGYGVFIAADSLDVIVGTNGDGTRDNIEGNLISGNTSGGVQVVGTQNTWITGNKIGTNIGGTAALANGGDGIYARIFNTNLLIGTNGDGLSDLYERNLISGNAQNGVHFDENSDEAEVSGNYIGTNAAGTAAIANGAHGVLIADRSSNNLIGFVGNEPAKRNLISGNTLSGVRVEGNLSNFNSIGGNYIGTDASGKAPLGNKNGIEVDDSAFYTYIGNTTTSANIISGNIASGITIGTDCDSTTIWSNIIGLDAAQTGALGNGTHGIYLTDGAFDSDIHQNTISANVAAGIFLSETAGSGNDMGGNDIFDNGGLGIDLAPLGVNPNDPGDTDSGPNNLMNYPEFTTLVNDGTSILVDGFLDSEPNKSFTLDIMLVEDCDPSGYGEGGNGIRYTENLSTNSSGIGEFSIAIPYDSATSGYPYMVLATEYSEFSECKLIENSGSADPAHLSIADASLEEGDSGFVWMDFEVTLDHTATTTVTASFHTADVTALYGKDYTYASGTVSFPPGTTQQTITVAILGDTQAEPHETFRVVLHDPQGAEIQDGQATGTILDDDGGSGYYLYLPIIIR